MVACNAGSEGAALLVTMEEGLVDEVVALLDVVAEVELPPLDTLCDIRVSAAGCEGGRDCRCGDKLCVG